MPVHDWRCAECGAEILDRYQPRTTALPPFCPAAVHSDICDLDEDCSCDVVEKHVMERFWSFGATSRPFDAFDLDVPGRGTIRVSDLHQLRRLEKASAEMGQPIAVRQYSMDPGKGVDRNVFGPAPNRERPVTRSSAGIPFRRMIRTRD